MRLQFSATAALAVFIGGLVAEVSTAFSPLSARGHRLSRTALHTPASVSPFSTQLAPLFNNANGAKASEPTPLVAKARKYASYFCNLFPIWTLLTAGTALARPETFLSIPSSTFPAQIGMLMLCMGITLKPSDFKRVAQRPAAVLLAFLGCYGVVGLCQSRLQQPPYVYW